MTRTPDTAFRRLWPSDRGALRDHLLRLDAGSRHDRFAMGVSDAFLAGYASRCFRPEDVIYGYFEGGQLRGAGELRGLTVREDATRAAEAAFSVEKGWRRRGAGSGLFARLVRAARNRRVALLYMTCLAHNAAMQSMARKFSTELRFETDAVTGRLIARAPTALSLWSEAADDAQGFATMLFDLQRRLFRPQAWSPSR